MAQLGEGKVNVLYGAAIVTVGDIVGFQEGVIDMWGGEGAKWTPFSKTYNLVVDITPVEGLDPHAHEATVRSVGLKAAELVGEAGRNVEVDEILTYEIGSHAEETKKNTQIYQRYYM